MTFNHQIASIERLWLEIRRPGAVFIMFSTYTGLRILIYSNVIGLRRLGKNAVARNLAYCIVYIEHLFPVVIEPSLKTILKVRQSCQTGGRYSTEQTRGDALIPSR
jgi:hypothetical protein